MKKRYVIIVNPAASHSSLDDVQAVCRQLRDAGHEAEFQVSEYIGNCTERTRAVLEEGVDVIVASGGDGTVSEIADTMAGSGVPLGVFPRGTVNILALEIGLRNGVRAVSDCLLHGVSTPMSLGRAGGRHFVLMAGVGFDARVVDAVTPEYKKRHGKMAYVRKGIAEFMSPSPVDFAVRSGQRNTVGASVIVCNAKRYGGPFRLAPQADIRDPLLDVLVFRSRTKMAMVRYGLAVLARSHHRFPDVEYWRTERLEIRPNPSGEEPMQVDGDVAAEPQPWTVQAIPEALNVLMPRA